MLIRRPWTTRLKRAVRRLHHAIISHPTADLSRLPLALDLRAISIAEGLRAGLTVAALLALNEWLQWPPMMEAALSAWLACLCDQGGPIRRRVPVLLGFTLASAAIVFAVGLARGGGLLAAVPIGSFGLFCLAMLRIYGQAQMVAGNLLSVMLVLALDAPLTLPTATVLSLACIGGGLWATFVTMVVWRIHPYGPARRAVAACYAALADLVRDVSDLVHADFLHATAWEEHARAHRRGVRTALEAARTAVHDTIRVRGPISPRASESLIRLEVAEQMFTAMVALTDVLEQGDGGVAPVLIERALIPTREVLLALSHAMQLDARSANPRLEGLVHAIETEIRHWPDNAAVYGIVSEMVQRLRVALTLSVPANFLPGSLPDGTSQPLLRRIIDPLRANLTWNSASLRHATRVAVVAVPAFAVSVTWAEPYQHWLTITLVLTMQPFFATTLMRAAERIGGTVLGGAVAAVLAPFLRTPLALSAAIVPFAVVALAVRQVSFGLFMVVVTPLVVLLVELSEPGAGSWEIVLFRAAATIAGGLLALAGSLLLWPSWEPARLVSEVRAAIAAHRQYAEAELASLTDEGTREAVEQARRAAGAASNNLEASIARALQEPGHGRRLRLEAAMVIDAALRRMGGRLSAMQLDLHLSEALPPEQWREWRRWIGAAMDEMAAGRSTNLPPRPATQADEAIQTDALRRIVRQVDLMNGAIRRLHEDQDAQATG